MIHVYLDDLRPCPKGFVLARNAAECIELLKSCEVDILSLDHDLGWDELTGYDVAKFIVESGRYAKDIYLHTSSAMGRSNMFHLLYKNRPEHVQVHMIAMPDELLLQVAKDAEQSRGN
jgi:hypothetical protein